MIRRLAALVVVSLAALVSSTGAAAAHAKLLSMKPADGSTVGPPPVSVVLTYSEVMQNKGAEVAVTAPSGARVDQGPPTIVDDTVTQPLGAVTEAGVYRVVARVVSGDGHPITDQGSFTVRNPAPVRPASQPTADPVRRSSSAGAVAVSVGWLAMVFGGLGVALVRHQRARSS